MSAMRPRGLKVTAVTVGTITANRVTAGRSVKAVDVLLPLDPAQLPKAGGFTYYQYTDASTWSFRHPLGRIPQVALYDLNGVGMDTDVDVTTTTITLTFAEPMSGYIIVT